MDKLSINRRQASTAWFRAWGRAALFGAAAAAAALSLSAYTAPTSTLAMRQIYFNAWHVLPGFTVFMTLLSWVVIQIAVSLARDYGLAQFALELVFRAMIRAHPAAERVLCRAALGRGHRDGGSDDRVSGELDELLTAHIDPYERELCPASRPPRCWCSHSPS